MANTRRTLKPYKGFEITVQNGYKYMISLNNKIIKTTYSLQDAKKEINHLVDIGYNESMFL